MSESAETPGNRLISVTRIRLKDPRNRHHLFALTNASLHQSKLVDGLLERPKIKNDGDTFYTLSVWDSEESMEVFKNQGSHQEAMNSNLGESDSHHWYSDHTPSWKEAIKKLDEEIEKRKNLPQKF